MTDVLVPAPTADEVVPGLLEAFARAFGRPADGVWSAPGRVNLIGEHVDYNGGLCLPLALPHRTFAAVAPRDDGRVRVGSLQEPEGWEGELDDVGPGFAAGPAPGWAGYAVGVGWALRRAGHRVTGFDALVDGRVPLGAGLSSSAALEASLAVALDELAGLGLAGSDDGRARLAAACVAAEREIAGAPTGGLDQAVVLRSAPGAALLVDCRDGSVTAVPLPPESLGTEFLVVDTRARHALVDGQYGSARDACERAARLLAVPDLGRIAPETLDDALGRLAPESEELVRRTRHVVTEIQRVSRAVDLLRAGSVEALQELGGLFDASHASLRDDFRVSCPELDVACAASRDAGAWGARMTGGGFGGSAVVLVPRERRDAVITAVRTAFADHGFGGPGFLEVGPAFPAGRSA